MELFSNKGHAATISQKISELRLSDLGKEKFKALLRLNRSSDLAAFFITDKAKGEAHIVFAVTSEQALQRLQKIYETLSTRLLGAVTLRHRYILVDGEKSPVWSISADAELEELIVDEINSNIN